MIPSPGAHGDDALAVARALGLDPGAVIDLAQTLNPVAPDVVTIAGKHLDALRSYPDAGPATACLARALDVDPACLVLTNGGAEAIALVAAELGQGWVEDPEFSLYARHLRLAPNAGRWRSNPHNPTGRLAAADERAAVWDEAFWPITCGTWTRGDADDGAIVIGSLTKLFACPGLRVGYVVAPDAAFASAIRARQPQWSVNGLAAAVLPALLQGVDLPAMAARVREMRDEFASALVSRGLEVEWADAPWVLVRRGGLRDLLARHGVIVRDCASFGWSDTFRVATPRTEQLGRVLEAIDRVLETEGER